MRVYELSEWVTVDLDEVISIRWAKSQVHRPRLEGARVVVHLRDGSEAVRTWPVFTQHAAASRVAGCDSEAEAAYWQVVSTWRREPLSPGDRFVAASPALPLRRAPFPQGGHRVDLPDRPII